MNELSPVIRVLSKKEKRAIQKQIIFIKNRSRQLKQRLVIVCLVMFGFLSALTILLSDDHWPIIIIFYTIIGGLISFSIWHQEKENKSERLLQLENVLNKGSVSELRIQATNVVQFEEEEDEGACFAFQYALNELIFISGQEFYESSKFPNNDFSLIHIQDSSGKPVEFFIEKHGQKLKPNRVVPAQQKSKLKIPEHLSRISGNIDDIEKLLQLMK